MPATGLARPDLMVADVLMPQIDGYEFCRMVREISRAPILLLMGLGMPGYMKNGLRLGADESLVKPISMHFFLRHVSNLLHPDRLRRSTGLDMFRSQRG